MRKADEMLDPVAVGRIVAQLQMDRDKALAEAQRLRTAVRTFVNELHEMPDGDHTDALWLLEKALQVTDN